MWCAIAESWCTLTCQISARSVYSVAFCWRKTPISAVFWTCAFSVVASCQPPDKVEHECTTTNLPLSNCIRFSVFADTARVTSVRIISIIIIKIVSVLQRLHGEIGRTFSDVQKRDGQTDKRTKTQRFWPLRRRVKSEPHQTWHGDRGPRERSCISKTFGGLMHSFAARGR